MGPQRYVATISGLSNWSGSKSYILNFYQLWLDAISVAVLILTVTIISGLQLALRYAIHRPEVTATTTTTSTSTRTPHRYAALRLLPCTPQAG